MVKLYQFLKKVSELLSDIGTEIAVNSPGRLLGRGHFAHRSHATEPRE